MNYAIERAHALNHDQIAALAVAIGHSNWIHVEGIKGIGKTTLLKEVSRLLPNHIPRYVDTTMLEAGDLAIPKFKEADDQDFVRFVANEALGLHLDKPLIILLDELPKSSPAVKIPLMRLCLEREFANYKAHPETIIISTGNLGVENLGDSFQSHQIDRMTRVELRTPTALEWLENYAIPNGVNYLVCGWVKENQETLADWRDVQNPDNNLFCDHPNATDRVKGTTPRSVVKAAGILDMRDTLDDDTLLAALIGTIGYHSAHNLMTFIQIADQLPSLESIKQDPANAKIPSNAPAVMMVVWRLLAVIERGWVDSCMTYLSRLDTETQGVWVGAVMDKRYDSKKQSFIAQNRMFTEWAGKYGYLLSVDKV